MGQFGGANSQRRSARSEIIAELKPLGTKHYLVSLTAYSAVQDLFHTAANSISGKYEFLVTEI
ncbi:hypothetical protein F2Q70_00034082 [Brassica cretica]|uniref:Uncharacterized protein n=1 Tax=Brassica cretica TaxID=69181 RepID=A0A3N6R5I8_BRACR|nr:hypothetical protein F2Q70_00034082 [Brassica cretica]KAF3575850.1 hypothetical protein DY000_02030580 [Brassica cretica]